MFQGFILNNKIPLVDFEMLAMKVLHASPAAMFLVEAA